MLKQMINVLSPQVSQGWVSDNFVPIYSLTTVSNLLQIIEYQYDSAEWHAGSRTGLSPTLEPALPRAGMMTQPTIQPTVQLPTMPDLSNITLPTTSPVKDPISKYLVEDALNIAADYIYLSLLTQVVDERPLEFDVGIYHTEALRVRADTIKQTMDNDGCNVKLPATLLGSLPSDQEVLQVMTAMITNPYKWHYGNDNPVTSKTVVVHFSDLDWVEIPVWDLPPEDIIVIEVPTEGSLAESSVTMDRIIPAAGLRTVNGTKRISELEYMTLYTVTIGPDSHTSSMLNMTVSTAGGSIHIQIKATPFLKEHEETEETDLGQDQYGNLSLHAYVGVNYIPTGDEYDYSLHLTAESMNSGTHLNGSIFILDM